MINYEWRGVVMIKLLKDFPGYAVSDSGQIYSKLSGAWRKYKSSANAAGYGRLTLKQGGKYIHRFTHRVVCEYFDPNWSPNLQVNHKDGNKMNNKISNLEMVTAKQNIQHALQTGLCISGEASIHAKLNYSQVVEIRNRLQQGERGCWLAKEYGICAGMVSCIKNNKNWQYSK